MPYYYKNPNQNRELGPFEERVIIARMIDGEINARSLVRTSAGENWRTVADSDFAATLENLTSRWRRNIVALKNESLRYYLSLLFSFAVAATYIAMLFVRPAVFAEFRMFCGAAGLFLCGLILMGFFGWLYAYRMWRVVPKSRYRVAPGWRIMLTYVPFFRFGWNFCMWGTLSTRLRELTNYTCYAGRAAAIFYSVCAIVASLSLYALAVLPWPWEVFTPTYSGYRFLLGLVFWGLFLISGGMTLIAKIVMLERQKAAALTILRRRYAYNVPMKEVVSPFMLNILQRQRKNDRQHRWGHGIGIAGTLFGWPLILFGIPLLVLGIVGSCSYENSLEELRHGRYCTGAGECEKFDGASEITHAVNRDFRDFGWDKTGAFCRGEKFQEKVFRYLLMKSPAGYFVMNSANRRLEKLGDAARAGETVYAAEKLRQLESRKPPRFLRSAVTALNRFALARAKAGGKR